MGNICYHGTSSEPFDRFKLCHILDGNGKCKFGVGIYVTTIYKTAAHYAGTNPNALNCYVYTVSIPERRNDNCIDFNKPVYHEIVKKTSQILGIKIPAEVIEQGKFFKKYLANYLVGNIASVKRMMSKTTIEGEKAVSSFLRKIGVDLISWPYTWKEPDTGTNYIVLDDSKIHIIHIDKIKLNAKNQLIDGSQIRIK